MHADPLEFDIDTRFRMVKEAGVFDYLDKTPSQIDWPLYHRASEKYGVPITCGAWFYMLGRDEPLLQWHLQTAGDFGTRVHDVQILTNNRDGRRVTNEEVADVYCWAAEIGEKNGVVPCFEVHVNMWSEHFGRVEEVARLVKARGVEFNITLDHSHVIFKIDNPIEQEVQGMREDVEAGRVVLDPYQPGNVCERWIEANWVRHAHARAAFPNGPVNVWAMTDGKPGRGIQAPFVCPRPGEWHAEWSEEKLEPWKEVVRRLLKHHANDPVSRLATFSTEFIPSLDYGGGAKYSIFEQNVACAEWIKKTWEELNFSPVS